MKHRRAWIGLVTGSVLAALTLLSAIGSRGYAQETRTVIFDPQQGIYYADANDKSVRALPVRDNIWMIVGAGGNITVQTGKDGVLIVDTGSGGALSEKVQSLVRQLSTKPIRYILNTSYLSEHTGGNKDLREMPPAGRGGRGGLGAPGGGRGGPGGPGGRGGTPIAAHENVLARLSAPTGQTAPTPANAWPTETFYTMYHDIYFNGEGIQMLYQPRAVTDGDSLVYFRRSDVISAGDIFLTTTYPRIDLKAGGSINGIIDGLNHILEVTIPAEKQEGGTLVIPGHGRICDEADVLEYRDMLTIVRDRIQDAIRKGQTLEQVQAAGLTTDYDPRYGRDNGPWTTAMFIEAAYESLSSKD